MDEPEEPRNVTDPQRPRYPNGGSNERERVEENENQPENTRDNPDVSSI